MLTLAQAVALANEHPVGTLVTVATAFLGGFYAVSRWVVKMGTALGQRVIKAFDDVAQKVDGFQEILAAHEREDVRRFAEIETRGNERHETVMQAVTRHNENVMSAVQRHADTIAAPMADTQLEQSRQALRLDALEAEPPRRKGR